MKTPGTSDWLIIGSVAMWCVGVVWYVPALYVFCGLVGKTMEKALEIQRHKDTVEAMENFAEKFTTPRSGVPDMTDAIKNAHNLVSLFTNPKDDPGTSN